MKEPPLKREASQTLFAALKMLARRDYFRAELKDRLAKKDFRPEVIEEVLNHCTEMGYLDDATLAKRFAELRAPSRGWGPTRIRAELMTRGVDEATSVKASELPGSVHEQAMATALRRASARARDGWWRTGEGRSLMISSLLRRGFEPEEARRTVGRQRVKREAADHAIDDQPGDPEGIS